MIDTVAPTPTKDLSQGLADLAKFGACIITDVLDSATVEEVRTTLYRIAESNRKHGWEQTYDYGGDDGINQRVWNLPSRDPPVWFGDAANAVWFPSPGIGACKRTRTNLI